MTQPFSKNLILFVLFSLILPPFSTEAQELNATVSVVRTGGGIVSDDAVLKNIESLINSFLNDQSFTEIRVEPHERIECSFQLNLNNEKISGTQFFEASMLISATRPVYGSDEVSRIFVHNDPNVNFLYEPGRPLRFSENRFEDNLSSILAYYAYLIIALDHDSFGLMAGEPFFQSAMNIVTNAKELGYNGGWFGKSSKQNRFWLIQNLTAVQYRRFRQGFYQYHRLGLDNMYQDPVKGRKDLTDALSIMDASYTNSPNQMLYQILANSKTDELVEIFKAAPTYTERNKIMRFIQRFDPSKARLLNDLK